MGSLETELRGSRVGSSASVTDGLVEEGGPCHGNNHEYRMSRLSALNICLHSVTCKAHLRSLTGMSGETVLVV